MTLKSDYQLVNRGRKHKPSWTVERNGVYLYSNRFKGIAEGFLLGCRDRERQERAAKKQGTAQ